jgi:hypothetical protein
MFVVAAILFTHSGRSHNQCRDSDQANAPGG